MILLTSFSQGQRLKLSLKPPGPNAYSKAELAQDRINHNCVHKSKISFSSICKKYPYNETSIIQLVSFDEQNLPMQNDSVAYSRLKEVKTLTLWQVDTLSDIFYNVGFGGLTLSEVKTNCYNPRNAVSFLNNSGKVFAFLELCFECEDFRPSSENIYFGDKCNQKYLKLKKIFQNSGINYGTEDIKVEVSK